ncbi:TatD family hydrolase [Patescibacteria group bacterium]|nr:TatD family hydrolase [Patescibacteria group bacterium]
MKTMKYIDTHAHMNFAAYDDDRDNVIARTNTDEVMVINVGTQRDTSRFAVELAEQHDHLYAIIGLHPIHTTASFHDHDEVGEGGDEFTSRGEDFDVDYYRNLAQSSNKVVGLGECGLDYYRNTPETRDAQEKAFRGHIELALELDLPLMLHVRPSEGSMDAYHDVLTILREYVGSGNLRGQTHFFAGTPEIAQEFIDLGFYISFTGVITFAGMYEKLVKAVPMNRILSETDAPYVTPHPYRGQRNEPSHVREVIQKLAKIKKVDENVMAQQVIENAKRLYGI